MIRKVYLDNETRETLIGLIGCTFYDGFPLKEREKLLKAAKRLGLMDKKTGEWIENGTD